MTTTKDPRSCYYIPVDSHIPGRGYRVAIVTELKPGYAMTGTWPYTGAPGETLPYFWGGDDYDAAVEAAKRQNGRRGLTERDVTEIIASSMGSGGVDDYNDWFARGYAAFATDEPVDDDLDKYQRAAWRDGFNSAAEEAE